MKSIAIWTEDEKNRQATNFIIDQLHLNFWKIKGVYKLDVGIEIKLKDIDSICFFLPFKIESGDINDLSNVILEKKLCPLIFNEKYLMQGDEHYSKVSHKEEEKFYFIHIDKAKGANFTVEDFDNSVGENETDVNDSGGSIVKINLKGRDECSLKNITGRQVYFRFRITSCGLKKLIHEYKSKDSLLNSAVSKTEAIDFKINNIRNLYQSFRTKYYENYVSRMKIKALHFLLLRDVEEDLLIASKEPDHLRLLESNSWGEYLGVKKYECLSSYHWVKKDNKGINHYRLFIKMRYRNLNWGTIALYIGFTGFMAILFNLLAGLVFNFFECSCVKLLLKIIDIVDGA